MSWYKYIIPKTATGAFWLSFGLCLAGGLFIIFVIAPVTGISQHFGPGQDGYIQLARSLARGDGYRFEENGSAVFHRPPMYTLLLVPITFLPDFLQRPALILMQSLMVGCIAALIFQIAGYFFNLFTAQTSVVIFLLNPWVYWNAKNPMTVIFQALLFTIFAVLVGYQLLIALGRHKTAAGKGKVWVHRLVIGIVGSALVLTHGTMLAVSAVFLLMLLIVATVRRSYQIMNTSIIATVIMVALISPWTYRNWVVFHRFIPVVGGAGLAYFNGNVHWTGIAERPQQNGESYIDASLRVTGIQGTEATHTHWNGLKDIELEDRINKKMVEHLRSHPGIFVKKVLLNAVEYYFPMLTYPYLAVKRFSMRKLAITIFHLVLWILALVGFRQDKKQRVAFLPAALMLVAIVIYAIWFFPFATFIGHSLYTFGTMPFLSILAARELVQKFSPDVSLNQTSTLQSA